MFSDPYQTLGISRTASDREIKKAYRNLSRQYHPDNYTDPVQKEQAEEKFRQAIQNSEYFQNDKEGFSILSYDGGNGKDNLKSFVVVVKLKEPLKK